MLINFMSYISITAMMLLYISCSNDKRNDRQASPPPNLLQGEAPNKILSDEDSAKQKQIQEQEEKNDVILADELWPKMSDWEKRAWIAKAARSLRYQKPLGPGELDQAWLSKSRIEIIDIFMNDARFADTVLDFNLYFLGFKSTSLIDKFFSENQYSDLVLENKPAIKGALALVKNKNYFEFFVPAQSIYVNNLEKVYNKITLPNSIDTISSEISDKNEALKHRQKYINLALSEHDTITKYVKTASIASNQDLDLLCNTVTDANEAIFENLFNAGLPFNLISSLDTFGYTDLQIACFIDKSLLDLKKATKSLEKSRDFFAALLKIIAEPRFEHKKITQLSDLKEINLSDYGIQSSSNAEYFGEHFWRQLPNSSTNQNRKRAAYILKTYFCDDLTPINIIQPDSHSENKHASDAGCAACHYKLDPMAGFFRFRGFQGFNFENEPSFVFDDLSALKGTEVAKYHDNWRDTSNPNKWNIGYIRSAKESSINTYGENLADLNNIILNAPEVRQCLTQRMAEYFLGKNQSFDGEWLNYLSKSFHIAAKSSDKSYSSKAFKNNVKRLLLSRAFTQADPEAAQCYDQAPGQKKSSLPCEVSFIIKNNCVSCHTGKGASGRLDLSSWIKDSSGSENFIHLDRIGKAIDKKQTLQSMLNRLSTNDENIQMPLNKHMDAVERANLFKWLNQELEKISQ